ncbi:MAG: Crp/Fnr family transcriptional regulator [Lysobacteraceae bacterium]
MRLTDTASPIAANQLLMHMPKSDRQHLIERCDEVDLMQSDVLCERGDRINHVYFPIDCSISMTTPAGPNGGFELSMVGAEGMQGITLVLGIHVAPQRGLVQSSGSALRMTTAAFRSELASSRTLPRLLDRYLYVLMSQMAQAGICAQFHPVEARLARCLLVSCANTISEEIHLTHELLGFVLGARRESITEAAGALQEKLLIRYARGSIVILDREGLEAASCSCYDADRTSYAAMFG